jgi:hypothetical protein
MIVSREDSQDQVQVYSEGIVESVSENPESELVGSCSSCGADGPEYCETICGSCKFKCINYDNNEVGCRSLDYCGWNPLGKSGRGNCVESCGVEVTPPSGFANGESCSEDGDCASNTCFGSVKYCRDASCDGCDNNESIKCGICTGEICQNGSDCRSGICTGDPEEGFFCG